MSDDFTKSNYEIKDIDNYINNVETGYNKEIGHIDINNDGTIVVYDLEGNEIQVSDGNTFIHICPKNANVTIEGIEEAVVTDTTSEI